MTWARPRWEERAEKQGRELVVHYSFAIWSREPAFLLNLETGTQSPSRSSYLFVFVFKTGWLLGRSVSRGLLGSGFQGTEGRGGGRHRTKVETGVEGGCEWGDQLLVKQIDPGQGRNPPPPTHWRDWKIRGCSGRCGLDSLGSFV